MLGLRSIAEAPESSQGGLDVCRVVGSAVAIAVSSSIFAAQGVIYSWSTTVGLSSSIKQFDGTSNASSSVSAHTTADIVYTNKGALLGFGSLSELAVSSLENYVISGYSEGYATVSGTVLSIASAKGIAAQSALAIGVTESTNVFSGNSSGTTVVTGEIGVIHTIICNASGICFGDAITNSFVSSIGAASGTSSVFFILDQTVAKTDHIAYVKIPSFNLLWGTDVGFVDGVWSLPLLSTLPEPSEALSDSYGIADIDNLRISIADSTLNTSAASLIGEVLEVHQILTYTYTDDTTSVVEYNRTYTVKNFTFSPGVVTLNCVDIDNGEFSKLFPTRTYVVEDWPLISSEVVGTPVPDAAGTGVKLPCTLINPPIFEYAVAIAPTTILNVYRDGRLIPPTEYVVGTSTSAVSGYTVATITFALEQKDFSGNYYVLEADCRSNDTNAASELLRVLTSIGVIVNASSFTAGIVQATNLYMNVDIGYRKQRTASAIINDLLLILRGSLYRGATGYELIQDIDRPLLNSWDETSGDYIEVNGYTGAEPPEFVEVEYKPNVADPEELMHVVTKSAGGYTGTKRYTVPYISDHQSADRLLDYLAKRLKYSGTVTSNILSKTVSISNHIRLSSDAIWTGYKDFNIRKITRGVGQILVTGLEYNSSVYDYSPQTYPVGATDGYVPDYSKTPPAAPTSLLIEHSLAAATMDGTVLATVRGSAIPPSVNWVKMYLQATNTLTNEIYQVITHDIGYGRYGATLASLRPAQPHTMVAWAENAFGVQGYVSESVAFTSAGYATLPAAPTGVLAKQGTGKVINVTWNASSSGTIVDHYDVYRSVNWGPYYKVSSAQGSYADTNVLYSSNYTYKVKAVDRSSNQSVDSATSSVTLSVNVGTTDLVDSGVTTGKRQSTNTVSWSPGTVSAYSGKTYLVTHNLGKQAIVTAYSDSGSPFIIAHVQSNSINSFYLSVYNGDASAHLVAGVHANFW